MIINRSSKYNAKDEFWHDGRIIGLSRVWGGLGLHGSVKFAVVVGEEEFYRQTHYYILCEAQTDKGETIPDLVDVAVRMEAEYKIKRWFGRLDENVKALLAVCNKQLYTVGVKNFVVMDSPRLGEYIDESVSLIHKLVRPHNKRLHFFAESMIPSELQEMPGVDIRADQFPRATALSNAIGGLLKYAPEHVAPEDLVPPVEAAF